MWWPTLLGYHLRANYAVQNASVCMCVYQSVPLSLCWKKTKKSLIKNDVTPYCVMMNRRCDYILMKLDPDLESYEGRSINKLQNGVILLIFKIWKIRNTGCVRNLILNSSCELHYDDVTVTSFVNYKYSDATAESIP